MKGIHIGKALFFCLIAYIFISTIPDLMESEMPATEKNIKAVGVNNRVYQVKQEFYSGLILQTYYSWTHKEVDSSSRTMWTTLLIWHGVWGAFLVWVFYTLVFNRRYFE